MTGNAEYVPLEAARDFFLGRPSVHRIRCWIRSGLFNGRIKLDARRSGKQWFVTREKAEAFERAVEEAVTAEWGKNGNGKAPETPSQAKRRREARGKRLDRQGVRS